jgi:putative MATE family efflux protein
MQKMPSYRSIWRLALPALLGGIVEPILSLTDIAVVGNIDSSVSLESSNTISAVAAVGIAGSLLSALVWVFAQMKSAISAVVSQAFGAHRMKAMATLIPQMLLFNILVSMIATLATFFTAESIFANLLSASGGILNDATDYYKIRVWGFPLTLITFSIFGIFRGIQNTIWAMLISVIGGGLNILLDFLLVLGLWDVFPAYGVEGAAIASVISQAVMFLLALYFLFYKSGIKLYLSKSINKNFGDLLLIAGNLVLRTMILNIALILTHKYANIYGEKYAATHAVVLNLWFFSAFFLDSFATAANALAGKFLGARDKRALQRNLTRNMSLGVSVSLLLSLTVLLFHPQIMGLIIDNDKVWEVYPDIIYLFIICLPINAIAFVLDGVFKGMGKAKFLRNVLFISTLFGFLPVLLIGHNYYPGLQIVWWSIIAWMMIRSIIPFLYFRFWIRNRI